MRIIVKLLLLVAVISKAYATSATDLYLPGMNYLDFSAHDVNGKKIALHDYAGKIIVLEWVDPACAFVKKQYESKKMQSLQKYYTQEHDVVWLQIFPHDDNIPKNDFVDAQIFDEDDEITDLYQIRRIPEIIVINSLGIISYAGAIDSLRTAEKDDAWKASQNYIESTVDALVAKQAVEVHKTRAYGCKLSANAREPFRAV